MEMKNKIKRIRISGPFMIFVAMVVLFSILSRRFFTFSNAANIIRQASVLALAAFGQTFAILLAGIDLSIGAVMGLTSCTAAVLMVGGMSPMVALVIALLVALVCGLINGFVTNYIGLNPFVSTFGMWGMALGVALIITEERVIYGFPDTLRVFNDGVLFGVIPVPLIIVLLVWWVLHFFLKKTAGGIATYAIGGNEEAAALSGISVKLQKMLLYGLSGLMAGFAGIMFLSRANAAQAIDTIGYEFDSICAVVLGGTSLAGGKGGVKQTLLGVVLFATMRNGMNMIGINMYLQLVFIGVILIAAYIAESRKKTKPVPVETSELEGDRKTGEAQ